MLNKNLVANYLGTAFVATLQLMAIPLYLRFLGAHEWGLLSSLVSLSATLLLLEAGVSQSVARRISERGGANANANARIHRLAFATVERRYILLTLGISLPLAMLSGQLGQWLMPQAGAASRLLTLLALLMAASQVLGSLYRGALVGHGSQVRLNVLLMIAALLRHAAGIAVAAQGYGVAGVAFLFAGSFAAESGLRRWLMADLLSPKLAPPGELLKIQAPRVSGSALILSVAGAVGALSTQLDRIILGTSISAVDLGRYAIAATLSLAALQLIYPIGNALMPRLVELQRAQPRQIIMVRSYQFLLSVLLFVWIGALLVATMGLSRWLPRVESSEAAHVIAPMFLIHLIGTSMNALCVPLYSILLALHHDKLILIANLASLLVLVLVLIFLKMNFGASAGSIAWAISNTLLLTLYLIIYKRWTTEA